MLQALIILLAGGCMFWAGWSTPVSNERSRPQARVVVRPNQASVSPTDILEKAVAAGSYSLLEDGQLAVEANGWSNKALKASELSVVNALRGEPAPGQLALKPVPKGLEVLELPDKTILELQDGVVSLAPGPHELLLNAKGYLPKRLSLEIKPGETRDFQLSMDKIPRPTLPIAPPAAVPVRPHFPPPPVSRPLPPPRPRPRPAPRPAPRFTPVPPTAQPQPPAPVPMFTPVP